METKLTQEAFEKWFEDRQTRITEFMKKSDKALKGNYSIAWQAAIEWVSKFLCQKTDEAVGCDKCKHEGGTYCVGCYRQAPDKWESKTA